MSGAEKHEISSVPGSLDEALDALETDHAFLLEGGVFTRPAGEVHRAQARAVR